MNWLIALSTAFLYASIFEYCIHRWAMHSPGLGKIHLWEEHSIQHHAKKRNDINIALSSLTVFIAASPLLGFCFIFGWKWLAIVLFCSVIYAAFWSSLHAGIHKTQESWISRSFFFPFWETHHLNHHKHPNNNFGTVFIWTDHLFRTKIK